MGPIHNLLAGPRQLFSVKYGEFFYERNPWTCSMYPFGQPRMKGLKKGELVRVKWKDTLRWGHGKPRIELHWSELVVKCPGLSLMCFASFIIISAGTHADSQALICIKNHVPNFFFFPPPSVSYVFLVCIGTEDVGIIELWCFHVYIYAPQAGSSKYGVTEALYKWMLTSILACFVIQE